jgi:hypothetical protein
MLKISQEIKEIAQLITIVKYKTNIIKKHKNCLVSYIVVHNKIILLFLNTLYV